MSPPIPVQEGSVTFSAAAEERLADCISPGTGRTGRDSRIRCISTLVQDLQAGLTS